MAPADEGVIAHALDDLAGRSEVLAALIRQHGPYTPRAARQPHVFRSLAKAIVYQQLAGKAAASIHRRFTELVPPPLSASKVLSLEPETIRAAGLSKAKRDAVLDMAQQVVDGRLDIGELVGLDDEALTRRLCAVRGIGPWTAQMFLLFELGRLDVWPTGDLGVRKGFHLAFQRKEVPTARDLQALGEPFRPYRSIVAWYCWRILDSSRDR